MRAQWRLLVLTLVMVASLTVCVQVRELFSIRGLAVMLGGGAACLLVLNFLKSAHARMAFKILAVMLLTVSYTQWRAHQRLLEEIPKEWIGQTLTVSGSIDSIPLRTPYGVRFVFKPSAEQANPMVRAALANGSLPTQISTAWYDDDLQMAGAPELRIGQVWSLPLGLKPPHATQNPGVFDQEQDWFARDIRGLATVRVNRQTPVNQLPQLLRTETSLWAWIQNARAVVLTRIVQRLAGEDEEATALLKALSFGDQSAISSAQWSLFQETGVTHLVSVSGFHITMLAALAAWLTQCVWRRSARLCLAMPSLHAAQWVGLAVALSYAVLAGWALPAQRTVLMLGLWLMLSRLGVASSGVRVLCLALWLVLGWDPFAVLSVSFWLSFGAVAWLILALGQHEKIVESEHVLFEPNRDEKLLGYFGSQLAIGLALVPVCLYFFHQASLIGVLVNFVAIPLVSVVVTPLVLLMCVLDFSFGWLWPLAVAHLILVKCGAGLLWLTQLVSHGVWVHTLSWWQVLAIALLSVLLVGFVRLRDVRLSLVSAVILLAVLFYPRVSQPVLDGQVRVHFIDIGQGNAVLLQTAQHNWLYDTGPKFGSDSDAGARVVVPYLREIGVDTLDTMILSHNDADHTGGASSVSAALPVKQVLTSIAPERIPALSLHAGQTSSCVAGQSWQIDGVQFAMLSPNEETLHNQQLADNPKSCVLRIQTSVGEMQSLLLTGDIDALQEARLVVSQLGGVRDWHADILMMPHHGSGGSSSAPFIEATSAKWVIAQAGYLNSFQHPHPRTVARYQAAGVRVFSSVETGALQFCLGCDTHELSMWREDARKYWWD